MRKIQINSMTKAGKRSALALAVLSGLCGFIGFRHSDAAATPPAPSAPPLPAATPVLAATPDAGTATPQARDTARIVFTTVPSVNATVMWGKKLLGRIAPRQSLVVLRPRDSGPLDVIVRAAGYLPVQTRAHTFADTRIVVKLTTPEQKATLVGYRAPIDAGMPVTTDDTVPGLMPEAPAQDVLAP
jgi:hypothetical protein